MGPIIDTIEIEIDARIELLYDDQFELTNNAFWTFYHATEQNYQQPQIKKTLIAIPMTCAFIDELEISAD